MIKTNAFSQRVGDGPVGVSMKRYEDSDGNALWRLGFGRNCGQPMIEQDATVANLIDLRQFVKKCLEAIETDGGRQPVEEEVESET